MRAWNINAHKILINVTEPSVMHLKNIPAYMPAKTSDRFLIYLYKVLAHLIPSFTNIPVTLHRFTNTFTVFIHPFTSKNIVQPSQEGTLIEIHPPAARARGNDENRWPKLCEGVCVCARALIALSEIESKLGSTHTRWRAAAAATSGARHFKAKHLLAVYNASGEESFPSVSRPAAAAPSRPRCCEY